MKITHVIPNLEIGGAQRLVENLLPYLKDNDKNEIEVIVFRKTNSEIEKNIEKLGIKIINLDISYRSPKAIFKLRKYFKTTDIIHLHLFPVQYYSIIANFNLKKPLIFTEHSTFNKRRKYKILKFIEKIVYNKLDKVVSISNGVERSLKKWLNISNNPERFVIIENGIKIPSENFLLQTPGSLFGRNGKALLMISRFTDSKDQDTIIRSLKYIKDEDVFLVLVGDGERIEKVKALTYEQGVSDKVVFLGSRNDISVIIKASSLGIQSSHWEGFGLSAIEMMAMGLPVIASNVEGLREVVENAGLLFNEGNERELAELINSLLSDNKKYDKIKQKCLQRAQEYYIDKTAFKYLKLYKSFDKNIKHK